MTNPLHSVLNWFEELSRAQQQELAAMVLPSYDPANLAEPSPATLRALCACEPGVFPEEIFRRTVLLKGLIEVFLAPRSSREDWEQSRQTLDTLRSQADTNTVAADFLEKMQASMSVRSAQWIASATTWKSLVNTTLSDRELAKWYSARLTGKSLSKY